MKVSADLSGRESLSVAIAAEKEDGRIYLSLAEDLREPYPTSAEVFGGMAGEVSEHRHVLLTAYEARFGHTLPYLVPDDRSNAFTVPTALAAAVVVFVELWVIAAIQSRYMDTPFVRAALKVMFGGALVLATGILIGAS